MNHPSFRHEDGFEKKPNQEYQPRITSGAVCSIDEETWSVLSSSLKFEALSQSITEQGAFLPETRCIWNNYSLTYLGNNLSVVTSEQIPELMDLTFWVVLRNLEEKLRIPVSDKPTADPDYAMMELFSVMAEYDGGDNDFIAEVVEKTEDDLYEIYADSLPDLDTDIMHDLLTFSSLAAEFLYRRGTDELKETDTVTSIFRDPSTKAITCERTMRLQIGRQRSSQNWFELRRH